MNPVAHQAITSPADSTRPGRALDVLVVGGANTDFLVKGETLPRPGETITGNEFRQAPGGKGANQAVAAARLGARVAFIGCVGNDARGTQVLDTLRNEGVHVDNATQRVEQPTGVALVMVDAHGDKQILTAPGANHAMRVDHLTAHRELFSQAQVLLVQLEVPMAVVAAAVRYAQAAGLRVVLDPAPAPSQPLSDDLLAAIEVIRPDQGEATALTGVAVHDRQSARRAADVLIAAGAGAAIIGAPGGDLLVTGHQEWWYPHYPVTSVDTTGSGDAFAAAVAVSLARGDSLTRAAAFGSAAAAAKSTKLGAQAGLPNAAEVAAIMFSASAADR
jgi:ribokinase